MTNRNDSLSNELNKLIYSMDLIKSANKQSFNKLTEKILKNLEKGTSENMLKRVIESELCTTYGLFSYEFDSELISSNILKWWENTNY